MKKNYLRGCVEDRIDRLSVVDPISGCSYFVGYLTKDGYGVIHNPGGSRLAHRAAYEARFGRLADEIDVLHRCDNPQCVNVGHLFPGTHTDNMRDMQAKGRKAIFRREQHPRAKLDSSKAFEIRWYAAAGTLHSKLAEMYGVTRPLISAICRNEYWQQECHD